ncbi:cytochrome b5-like heme/steroid binding domain-containing protein [Glomus cerebriforme]|uniref:Cytochrome b5-like heme/steroid binding domain-containing protein n=1 Tax=Glomus cerebriforme TaxID=658196 RepID=A0A397T547_9GLOM|nr:cytochrome b5-like heme/steroid binding domain-containing protein [Glomus cerebriforme]
MYSLASKIYKSVIGSSEEQITEENVKQETINFTKTTKKNAEETSQTKQMTVKVSTVEETSNTTSSTIEFAVPASVPKMQVSDFNGTISDVAPAFPSIDSPQRSKKRTPLEKANKLRQKIALEPGHSPLDWAKLTSSGANLRGVSEIKKYTIDEVSLHKTKDDAWTVFNGKIYNITPYLKFHPGGEKELMRSAGKDGTKLFMSTHAWVNYDFMLEKCFVGFLVGEQRNSLI